MNTKKLPLLLALVVFGSCSPATPEEHQLQAPAPALVVVASVPPAKTPADTLVTYAWATDVCRFTGRYNPHRYTKEQLDNTHHLLFGSAMLLADATPDRPGDISQLSLDSLNQEYTRRIRHYRRLAVVPRPIFLQLKKQAVEELEQDYRAKKLTIQGFANPSILLATSYSGDCAKYARGLAAQNDSLLLRDWKSLIQEQVARNKKLGSTTDYAMPRFQQEAAAANWQQYAKIELLTYGWWNCVNSSIQRVAPTAEMYQEFDKLFTNVQSECDDVD